MTWQVYVNERLEDSMTDSLVESKHIQSAKNGSIFFLSFFFF